MKTLLLGLTFATALFAGNYADQRIPSREQQTEWIRQGEQAAFEAEPPKKTRRRTKAMKAARKKQPSKRRIAKQLQ
jgi:hypothetical protein